MPEPNKEAVAEGRRHEAQPGACTGLTGTIPARRAAQRRRLPGSRAFAVGLFPLVALLHVVACAEPFDRGVLWRLERPGVAPSYVFGTLHSSDRRVTTLVPAVAQAFAACRTLAMETYFSDADEVHFFEATQFEDGRRLRPLLGADTYARLKHLLGDKAPADDVLERTKPWAALLRLSSPGSAGDGSTLDRELLAAARMRHMSIVGLELPDEQVSALDGIPLDTQLVLLRHAIEHQAVLQTELEQTIQAWLARDLGALARISVASMGGDPALERHQALLTRRIVDDRTVVMVHRLFLPLRAGGVFIAVGALHLRGANGMLAQLQKQGYKLHRVY
ncbi:MAG TPA: TraB/GumN family protein [Casimicrobiaceae bacterium]|nr:TraB/GumN family protein [Casimicrobiaceae bacterium]